MTILQGWGGDWEKAEPIDTELRDGKLYVLRAPLWAAITDECFNNLDSQRVDIGENSLLIKGENAAIVYQVVAKREGLTLLKRMGGGMRKVKLS